MIECGFRHEHPRDRGRHLPHQHAEPQPGVPGQFSFNQYLIVDEAPMLFHAGQRQLFPLVGEAIRAVLPIERLAFVGLSHFEADECGALNSFLAAAPQAVPVCGSVAAMVSINDFADRAPRALADGEDLALGRHTMRWYDTPSACPIPGNAG